MSPNKLFEDNALALKPLYAELINSVSDFAYQKLMPFCMQWGEFFPYEPDKGIIFYGRATNGWITFESDVDKLFDKNSGHCIFALDDQMQWVEDCAGGKEEYYNSNRSAFWRFIRRTAANFYPEDELLHICWSNVCKIAPDGANPNDGLFYAQLPVAKKIMQKELEIFSPKHVVLLTGQSWCQDFLYFLNGNQHTKSIASYPWGSNNQYSVKVYKIGAIYFYVSEHPQGKNEDSHVQALIKAISLNT
ncbi:MAG: hypothetical protein K2M00_01870 [Muribaculaceae bacterium]|nr:hypothetical protein [Muribaculaceae bacterium]